MSWFQLLTPAQTTGPLLQGLDVVGGRVVPQDQATFAGPDDARAAFALAEPVDGAGRFVDYLLLPEDLPVLDVTDGELAPTRVPSGTSYGRIEADGSRHVISHYDTPAFGWRNMRGPVRPATEVGLRARWQDLDVVAALEHGHEGDVHLVALCGPDEDPPEGFEWTKTGVSRRTVPASACELYERICLVVHDGVPGRVVDVAPDHATLMLERAVPGSREVTPSWHALDVGLDAPALRDAVTREVPRS